MSRAELLAMAHGLAVMLKLNDNCVIAIDEKGESFAVYTLPEPKPVRRPRWARLFGAPECVNLCGHNLLRRHLTCGVCRWRRIKEGKLQPVVPVNVYFLAQGKDRRYERAQSWLVKKLLALVEFVSLWSEQHGVLHKR